MEKQTLVIVIIILACLSAAGGFIYLATRSLPRSAGCEIESPFVCDNPMMGPDGMMITIGNSGGNMVYIQDLTISQAGGTQCRFLKAEIKNLSKDYYTTILAHEAVPFYTTVDHPDGQCLMKGMVKGNWYHFELNITYLKDKTSRNAVGLGWVRYGEKNVSGTWY